MPPSLLSLYGLPADWDTRHGVLFKMTLGVVGPPVFDLPPGILALSAGEQDYLGATAERVRQLAAATLETRILEACGSAHVPRRESTRTVVREGFPVDRILEEARKEDADLLVLGTHARTGLPHLLLGSVAERVLRTSPKPVLTVAPWARAGEAPMEEPARRPV